ncbi:hypothetical protein BGZ57DRAFT_952375 [Hyaloscypha finlandica]|nr:hypothetical protein BGZ57DRAFT_952375 [Hyaloscypha finlandica]
MTKTIREIRSSYESFGSSIQALVLAISLAAIMSLEDEEVKANFNTNREGLIAQYRLGTEQALERADFLNHPNITLLQALTIYLSVLQHTGEKKIA